MVAQKPLGVQEPVIATCSDLSRALRIGNIQDARIHLSSLIQSKSVPKKEDEESLVPMLTTVLELPSNNRDIFALQLMLLAYCEERIGELFAHLDLWQAYAQCSILECRYNPKLFASECQSEDPKSEAAVRERATFWILSTLFRLDFLSENGARRMAEQLSHIFSTKELQTTFWTVLRETRASIDKTHASNESSFKSLSEPQRTRGRAQNKEDFDRRIQRLGKNRTIMADALSAPELCREQVRNILSRETPLWASESQTL